MIIEKMVILQEFQEEGVRIFGGKTTEKATQLYKKVIQINKQFNDEKKLHRYCRLVRYLNSQKVVVEQKSILDSTGKMIIIDTPKRVLGVDFYIRQNFCGEKRMNLIIQNPTAKKIVYNLFSEKPSKELIFTVKNNTRKYEWFLIDFKILKHQETEDDNKNGNRLHGLFIDKIKVIASNDQKEMPLYKIEDGNKTTLVSEDINLKLVGKNTVEYTLLPFSEVELKINYIVK